MRTLVTILAAVAVVTSAAIAQSEPAWSYYAAKFVCGAETVPPPPATLAIGKYKTIVNIHNPNYLTNDLMEPIPVVFLKKVVVSLPQGEQPLPPTCKLQDELASDHALQMDCITIKTHLRLAGLPSTGALEGFVVIEVPPQGPFEFPPPLDVVAVYMSQPLGGQVSTMDVETIHQGRVLGVPPQDPCLD